jgi:hypothetical protein
LVIVVTVVNVVVVTVFIVVVVVVAASFVVIVLQAGVVVVSVGLSIVDQVDVRVSVGGYERFVDFGRGGGGEGEQHTHSFIQQPPLCRAVVPIRSHQALPRDAHASSSSRCALLLLRHLRVLTTV